MASSSSHSNSRHATANQDQALMGKFNMGHVEDSPARVILPELEYDRVLFNATHHITASMVEMIWHELAQVMGQFVSIHFALSPPQFQRQQPTTSSSSSINMSQFWDADQFEAAFSNTLPIVTSIIRLIQGAKMMEAGEGGGLPTLKPTNAQEAMESVVSARARSNSIIKSLTTATSSHSIQDDIDQIAINNDLATALNGIINLCYSASININTFVDNHNQSLRQMGNTAHLLTTYTVADTPGTNLSPIPDILLRLVVIKNVHAHLTLGLITPTDLSPVWPHANRLSFAATNVLKTLERNGVHRLREYTEIEIFDSVNKMQVLLTSIPAEANASQQEWHKIVILQRRVVAFGEQFTNLMRFVFAGNSYATLNLMFLSAEEDKMLRSNDDLLLTDLRNMASAMYAKKAIQLYDMCLNTVLSILNSTRVDTSNGKAIKVLTKYSGEAGVVVSELLSNLVNYLQYHVSLALLRYGAESPMLSFAVSSFQPRGGITFSTYDTLYNRTTAQLRALTPSQLAENRADKESIANIIEPYLTWVQKTAEPVLLALFEAINKTNLHFRALDKTNNVASPSKTFGSSKRSYNRK
jgi:hypothetical protein